MNTLSEELPVDAAIDPDLVGPEGRVIHGDPVEVEEARRPEPEVTTLTEDERRDFSMLMTCGRRTKKITVMGHPVVIKTLTTADEMRIGLYTKPYLDSRLGFQRAWQVAVCAAGIVEAQGRPLVSDLRQSTDEDEIYAKRVEAVKEFYPIVVVQIAEAVMALEKEFAELADKLGKLSG